MIKKYVPGCENAKLTETASTIGIRESRHVEGDYRLEVDDILEGEVPEDSIMVCANSVDIHGRFGPKSNEYLTMRKGEYYGVPYGCLVPKKIENLLVAGRSISASSEAAGAIRVTPPVMAIGQAAGVAAALSIKEQCSVRMVDVQKLRQLLKENRKHARILRKYCFHLRTFYNGIRNPCSDENSALGIPAEAFCSASTRSTLECKPNGTFGSARSSQHRKALQYPASRGISRYCDLKKCRHRCGISVLRDVVFHVCIRR